MPPTVAACRAAEPEPGRARGIPAATDWARSLLTWLLRFAGVKLLPLAAAGTLY
jgi:hypothetical protein